MKARALFSALPLLAVMSPAVLVSLMPKEDLGKRLFFDPNLSNPPGQSCATCHGPEVGFTGPHSSVNEDLGIYPGAVHMRFGNRKPPASAYASFSPPLHFDADMGVYVGGQFWDGRAADLVEQAMGPFLNPVEQNLPNAKLVVNRVAKSSYAWMFDSVFGPKSLDPVKDVEGSYRRIAEAIAAYEASKESEAFTSKYDAYLAGKAVLTELEERGMVEFDEYCAACHPRTAGPYSDKPLFTDYSYHNVGMPKNPKNPFYKMPKSVNPLGENWVDHGLALTTGRPEDVGRFKVPTLRNVDKRPYPSFVKAYGHNGVFKSLKEVVHFYNTRDVGSWPAPEISENLESVIGELGDMHISDEDEDAIVAFLKTLTDGYLVEAP